MLEEKKKSVIKKVKKVAPPAPKVAKKAVVKKPSKKSLKEEWAKVHKSLKEAKKSGDKAEIKKWNDLFRELTDKLSKL